MLFGKRKRIVKRILVIEDEPLTAFDNEVMIKDAGYEVVATHDDFEEAVAALDREKIDLILSDVRLRGKRTGIQLAEEAKRRGVPVLFVTGHPPENAHELAIGCLHKPYSERQLRQALEAVDQHLAGKKPKLPRGLELYPSKDEAS
jgi:two-component system, response regulator PdtaR